ncbi:hypothetical protein THRCLA_08471 [Thraustotheca clavata]|uniref:Uncharacterized protein n=1 Tax=Thraustotheca clavata TaxID=74557 RepID=A0A1V9Z5W6_9STRA|nr:hypothetical protein THRCLA_08471 [Thraustotheca clavata]
MPTLQVLQRRVLLLAVASAFFFTASLVSIVQQTTPTITTYFCSPEQLDTVRVFERNGTLSNTQQCLKNVLNILTPTSLDVNNRPLTGITLQSLNMYCTAFCYPSIVAFKNNLFPPCDTMIDGDVRSIGSVAVSLCPNGSSVATLAPATQAPDRRGNYCSITEYDIVARALDLNNSNVTCAKTARKAIYPTMISMDIFNTPYVNISWGEVNAICDASCSTMLEKIKAYTFPNCDTLINLTTTLSLSALAESMCNVSNVYYHG